MKATVRIEKAPSGTATLDGGLHGGARLNPSISVGVSSWNGETGDVTYTAPVTSVNGQTGAVEGLQELIFYVDGQNAYKIYQVVKMTVSGVEGIEVRYGHGSPTNSVFIPNGNGLATVLNNVEQAIRAKQDALTFDNTPTENSDNPVTSDGIYDALLAKQDTLEFDIAPTVSSNNPVTSDGIYTALSGKQDTLTFDNTPTQSSDNPVTSDGVYTALQDKQDAGNYAASASGDSTHTAIRASGIAFGEVDSTSTSTAYTATVSGITVLHDGVTVLLKNGVVTSASGFTIDINGLGAKPVYSNMATGNDVTPTAPTRETTIFNINYTLLLIYSEDLVEGGAWINYRGYNSDTNTIAYQVRHQTSKRNMTDDMVRYRLIFSSPDDKKYIPANNSTSTNATTARTPITRPINPFGDILYYSYTSKITAGNAPNATYLYQQYVLTIGYSFTVSLTAQDPVYLCCTPQADGSAIIDQTTPIVQALPSTEDGKIYIYLGIATSGTAFELKLNHPVYYYKNNAVRLWTNAV